MPPNTSEHLGNTQVASYEVPISTETMNTVRWMCTHETKLLTVFFLSTQPGYFAREGMGIGFRDFIGPATKYPTSLTAPFDYCDNSLAETGIVEKGVPYNGRGKKTGYGLIEVPLDKRDEHIALAGALLTWSLDYPDISLQAVLSVPQSAGEISAQSHRLGIMMELLSSQKDHVPLADIIGISYTNGDHEAYDNIEAALSGTTHKLENEGLITVDRVIEDNDRVFEILDSNYPTSLNGTPRSLPIEGVYAFMQEHSAAGQYSFTFEECLRFVIDWVQQRDPEIDPANIRDKLSTALNAHNGGNGDRPRRLPGIRPTGLYNDGFRTRLHIVGDHQKALTELVNIFLNYEARDEEFLIQGMIDADRIIADEHLKSTLVDKAHRFSRAANKQPKKETLRQLLLILTEAGAFLTSPEIHALYLERNEGRQIGEPTIASYLGELVTSESLVAELRRRDPTVRTRHKYYGLPVQHETTDALAS